MVSLLEWLMPLELANRVFVAAYVAGLPLSLAFLLKSLKRPVWPSLLAMPFAYGDSFAWGFINYCAALPLGFLTCGFFVRAIDDAARRWRWGAGLALCLVSVLLFHVQVFIWLAVALPWLLATTRAPDGGQTVKAWLWARRGALLGVTPAVAIFAVWAGLRLSHPPEIAYGQPWKAWGPTFSPENLSVKPFAQNRAELIPTLSGLLRDRADSNAVALALGGAGVAAALALLFWLSKTKGNALRNRVAVLAGCAVAAIAAWPGDTPVKLTVVALAAAVALTAVEGGDERLLERTRMPGLALLALVLFFALPFDIRGFVYSMNTRYSHLFAALAVCCVPWVEARFWRIGLAAGALLGFACGWPLAKAFAEFEHESEPLGELWKWAPEKPKVMGLIFNTGAPSLTHPVYLHAAAVIARARGGVSELLLRLHPALAADVPGGQAAADVPLRVAPRDDALGHDGVLVRHLRDSRAHPSAGAGATAAVGRAGDRRPRGRLLARAAPAQKVENRMDDKRALTLTAPEVEKLSEADAALVLAAHVKAKQAGLIEALTQSSHKALARAAKKAAYQLKSQGVKLAEKKAEAPEAAPKKKDEWPALFTVVAGTGDLGMYLVRPQRGGGLSAWRAVVQDEAGLVMMERLAFNRGGYRKSIRAVIEEGRAHEVPFARAKEELGRALALNERYKVPLPPGAAEALMQLGIDRIDTPRPVPEPTKEDEALAAKGAALHGEPEIAEWLPSPGALKVLDQRAQETLASPLALSEAQKAEQLRQKARATAKEYFDERVRLLYAGRLILMAELFTSVERGEQSALATACARVLAHREGPGAFGQALFTKVIDRSLAAQAAAAQAAAEAPLSERPALAPPGIKRSPGGLVLP